MNIFTRITLWYNQVCPKHLTHKDGPGHPDDGWTCRDCQQEKYDLRARRDKEFDNWLVELRKGR